MKHLIALTAALLIFVVAGCALAQSFTPITVDGDNYLNNLDTCIASIGQITLDKDETFSFNRTVGARSEERGYCQAENGRGVDVMGGGVAQVATTIYLAVKNVESIEIVEKHTYGSDFCGKYVPDGADAVLADYGQSVDFKLTNRGEALTIDLWRDENKVYCAVSQAEEAWEETEAESETEETAAEETAE